MGRIDGRTGWAYSEQEFQKYYGELWTEKWARARPEPPPMPIEPSPPALPGPPSIVNPMVKPADIKSQMVTVAKDLHFKKGNIESLKTRRDPGFSETSTKNRDTQKNKQLLSTLAKDLSLNKGRNAASSS